MRGFGSTKSGNELHSRCARFLQRSADILSASGHSPLRLAEELIWQVFALRAGGQDVRDPISLEKNCFGSVFALRAPFA